MWPVRGSFLPSHEHTSQQQRGHPEANEDPEGTSVSAAGSIHADAFAGELAKVGSNRDRDAGITSAKTNS